MSAAEVVEMEADVPETDPSVQFVEYINFPFELQTEQQTIINSEANENSETTDVQYLLQEAEDIQNHVIVVHEGKQFLLSNDEVSKGEVTLSDANYLGDYEKEPIFLDDLMEEGELPATDNQYAVLKDGQFYLQDVTDPQSITGRNTITGKTITLENLLKQKKVPQYKRLVGKILGIKRPDGQMESINKSFNVTIPIKSDPIEMQDDGYLISTNRMDSLVVKTLCGLMDMDSFSKYLTKQDLVVKIIHKKFDPDSDCLLKEISYYKGSMKQTDSDEWIFEQDIKQDNPNDTKALVLHVNITEDETGKKRTKVLIPKLSESEQLCSFCNKMYKNMDLYLQHVESAHSEDQFVCDICNKKFNDAFSVGKHRKLHKGDNGLKCDLCVKEFNTRGALKRHISTHIPNLRPPQSTINLQKFTDGSSIKQNTETKSFHCDLCFKRFVKKGDLNFHRKTHDPTKQFTCETCGKDFNRQSNLMRHLEIHKDNGKIYKCELCGCSYNFMSSLTRHIVNLHMKESVT